MNSPNAILRGGPAADVTRLCFVDETATTHKLSNGNCYDHFRRHR
jgi:hypothetical protein